jgi:competence protein ComEA
MLSHFSRFSQALLLATGFSLAAEPELDPSTLDDSTLIWRAPAARKEEGSRSAATININTADAETLADALHGVGPAKARAIIDYRNSHGPFTSIEQLKGVKGIGEVLFRKNASRISVR